MSGLAAAIDAWKALGAPTRRRVISRLADLAEDQGPRQRSSILRNRAKGARVILSMLAAIDAGETAAPGAP